MVEKNFEFIFTKSKIHEIWWKLMNLLFNIIYYCEISLIFEKFCKLSPVIYKYICNKLECLSQAGLFSLHQYLQVRPRAYPSHVHLSCFPLW